MAKDSIRKKCRDCRRTWAGTKGKPQWCDDCGGELVEIPYRNGRKARARGR